MTKDDDELGKPKQPKRNKSFTREWAEATAIGVVSTAAIGGGIYALPKLMESADPANRQHNTAPLSPNQNDAQMFDASRENVSQNYDTNVVTQVDKIQPNAKSLEQSKITQGNSH